MGDSLSYLDNLLSKSIPFFRPKSLLNHTYAYSNLASLRGAQAGNEPNIYVLFFAKTTF